jgi:anti-anti-sigma factor
MHFAADLNTAILAALPGGREALKMDLSGVTEIDTAGLQILLMLRRHATREQRELTVLNASPGVRRVLELCRLTGLLSTAGKGALA